MQLEELRALVLDCTQNYPSRSVTEREHPCRAWAWATHIWNQTCDSHQCTLGAVLQQDCVESMLKVSLDMQICKVYSSKNEQGSSLCGTA